MLSVCNCNQICLVCSTARWQRLTPWFRSKWKNCRCDQTLKVTVPEWEGWGLPDCSPSHKPGSNPAGPHHRLGQPPSADHMALHWPATHPHIHSLLWELPHRTEPASLWSRRPEPGSESEENAEQREKNYFDTIKAMTLYLQLLIRMYLTLSGILPMSKWQYARF